ncbi:MAG: EF-P lysine aminoacylase EpmA [Pseudomonadota bacterium]
MTPTPSNTWQPNSSIEILRFRAELLANIRSFFKQKQVFEVETPLLSQAATCDVFIDSFSTSQYGKNYYLHTSPEFAMKRLLASGSGDIYQIAKVFRQEESGSKHNPEFTLLEWYRTGFTDQDLMAEVADLINTLLSLQSSTFHLLVNQHPVFKQVNLTKDSQLEVEFLSYRDCFIQTLSLNPHTATVSELKHCAEKFNLHNTLSDQDEKDRWLELLLSCVIEKTLSGTLDKPKMTFLYDYPASQASLARIAENNHGERVAKRFELYLGGMELANGFYELDNASEQLQRFEKDNQHRIKLGKASVPIDHHLIAALEHGLPSCAGVALGIDRLLMVMLGKTHIDEVLSFSFNRA